MTPADYNLKAQCEEGLDNILIIVNPGPAKMTGIAGSPVDERMPWTRAQRVVERLFRTADEDMTTSVSLAL